MKIAVIGHSHIQSLMKAWTGDRGGLPREIEFGFVQMREPIYAKNKSAAWASPFCEDVDRERVIEAVGSVARDASLVILCVMGNQHNVLGLVDPANRGGDAPAAGIAAADNLALKEQFKRYEAWLDFLLPHCGNAAALLPPPPPVESAAWIMSNPGPFAAPLSRHAVRPAAERLEFWRLFCGMLGQAAGRRGIRALELPPAVLSARGFLAEACLGTEPTHGNTRYGSLLLQHLARLAENPHPYRGLPEHHFWNSTVAKAREGELDPVINPTLRIGPADKVATAGSCFAQQISKRLRQSGYTFFVTEGRAPGEADAAADESCGFSARYGAIATARQLRQLFDRAFGYYRPLDTLWTLPNGRYCDPFRPLSAVEGHAGADAVAEDRRRHLRAVRTLFRDLDVFVFTLGQTECWISRLDGAAYPLAPGVSGGCWDPKKHAFVNSGVAEVVEDMNSFLSGLRKVNPNARVILTVSAAPLMATGEARHVLTSSAYSKAVLRVAADEVCKAQRGVYYFPSYEIITGPQAGGGYFGADRCSVTAAGLEHAMRVFMNRLTDRV